MLRQALAAHTELKQITEVGSRLQQQQKKVPKLKQALACHAQARAELETGSFGLAVFTHAAAHV